MLRQIMDEMPDANRSQNRWVDVSKQILTNIDLPRFLGAARSGIRVIYAYIPETDEIYLIKWI